MFTGLGMPVLSLFRLPRTAFAAGVRPVALPAGVGGTDGMVARYKAAERPSPAFRVLTLTTVAGILTVVAAGGVVRLTGSGLGCPDWPLCHGSVVPSADTQTLIEYSHRLVASVVGVLVLATAVIVWRSYRWQPWLLVPATLGIILLVIQVLLGGVTVMNELSPGLVVAHLAVAEALMASMLVVCLVSFRGAPSTGAGEAAGAKADPFPILALSAVLAGYALLLTGSYVASSGAVASCGQSWPLCQGQLIPDGLYPSMHMLHRVVALPVGALIVTVLFLAWRRRGRGGPLGWTATVVGALFLGQIIVGASVLWAGFPLAVRLLHLVLATLVWTGLAAMAFLAYSATSDSLGRSRGTALGGVGHA